MKIPNLLPNMYALKTARSRVPETVVNRKFFVVISKVQQTKQY
jgi:hypothetical protein